MVKWKEINKALSEVYDLHYRYRKSRIVKKKNFGSPVTTLRYLFKRAEKEGIEK